MAEKTSKKIKLDWTLIFAVAAWVLVLALGGFVNNLVDRQTAVATAVQEQQAIELALTQSLAASDEQLRQEARTTAMTRTTALVESSIQAAAAALAPRPVVTPTPVVSTTPAANTDTEASTTESSTLPAGSSTTNAYGRALIATKTGGNFRAAAYNGVTGASNLSYYQSVNSDVKAWLKIPGTNINYPVLQSTIADHYYEKLNWLGASSHTGTLWTQTATRFGDSSSISSNTVIYGHNWNNCRWNAAPSTYYSGMTMFEPLMSYHFASWAEQYPYLYYSTPSEQMTFVIFACFYTEATPWYNQTEPDVASLISGVKARSRHTFDVDVTASDKIITLSTCTRFYGNTSNQRFVVMARLLRPGEEIGPVTVTYNPNHQQPNVWG